MFGVRIGKNCFVGHFFCTTNDKNPIPNNPNFKLEKTIIEDNVSIGSNVTILPGLTIGKNSVIGAGSVVTKKYTSI